MQINGAHLATAFAPKPLELQEQGRKPVTIEAEANFNIEDETSAQIQTNTPPVQAAIGVNDAQQARFVRSFATNDEASTSPPPNDTLSRKPLSQGVQQYLQIADLQNKPVESILDEIV